MSALLIERLRTAMEEPRTHGNSLQRERLQEIVTLRRQLWLLRHTAELQDRVIERQNMLIAEQRELLRQAAPCPACVAKG